MVQPLFFPFLSLTPSDPICLPSNSSAPTLKHTVREQPPDPLIMPQTDPLQVQVEWTCFFPKPVAYDSGILPAPFSLGRWTQTGPRPLNILPPIISQGEWGWKNATVIGNWLGEEACPFH